MRRQVKAGDRMGGPSPGQRTARSGWLTYTVPAKSSSGLHELSIVGTIGWDIWVEDVVDALSVVGDADDLKVDLHSPGGFYGDGVAIFSLLDRRSGMNHVEVIGEAGSMASLIAMAGDYRTIREAGTFYVHRPWALMVGYEDELREEADTLGKLARMMQGVYMRSFEGSEEDLVEAMAGNGHTYSAEEAVEAGFIQEVVSGPSRGRGGDDDEDEEGETTIGGASKFQRAASSSPLYTPDGTPITTPLNFLNRAAANGWSPLDQDHRRLTQSRLRSALQEFQEGDPDNTRSPNPISPPHKAEIDQLTRLVRRMDTVRRDHPLAEVAL
jgi:ATP-dependent protease ClpP protease subunit